MGCSRSWAVLLATAAVAVPAASCGGPTAPGRSAEVDLEAALPDLSDVPRGYRISDSGCGALGIEGASPAMADVVRQAFPNLVPFCERQLGWAWRRTNDNPVGLSAHLVRWPDADLATRAFGVLPDLSQWLSGVALTPDGGPADIGDESLILSGYDSSSRPAVSVTAVAWRDGAVMGLVLARGGDHEPSRASAADLVGGIRDRASGGAVPRQPALDDRTVPIDDPDLDTPVWWLGERWKGDDGLPELELVGTSAPFPVDLRAGPGNSAEVEYRHLPAREGPSGGVIVQTWTRSDWRRFAATALGRSATRPPCARIRTVPRDGGSATLITIPEGKPPDATAPGPDCSATGRETMTWAIVTAEDAVVTVNLPICLFCFFRGPADDPYDTPAGIEAVVRGLERRS